MPGCFSTFRLKPGATWATFGGSCPQPEKVAPMPLSDIAIRRAKPADKPVRLFDGDSLYLEIAPSGGKWWRLKYRHLGKEKRLSVGTYPDTGLKDARRRRDEARELLAAGTDPGEARKADRAAQQAKAIHTLEIVGRAWLAHRAGAWVARTHGAIAASLENYIFPKLGRCVIRSARPDPGAGLLRHFRRLEDLGARHDEHRRQHRPGRARQDRPGAC